MRSNRKLGSIIIGSVFMTKDSYFGTSSGSIHLHYTGMMILISRMSSGILRSTSRILILSSCSERKLEPAYSSRQTRRGNNS